MGIVPLRKFPGNEVQEAVSVSGQLTGLDGEEMEDEDTGRV